MLRHLFAALRRLFPFPPRVAERAREEVDREIAFHLEERARRLVANGSTLAEAKEEARRRFGDLDAARQVIGATATRHDARVESREWGRGFADDLRYAARSLRRASGLATVAIITLALGIGVNGAMFGVLDRLLLSGPLHVTDPSGLRRVYSTVMPPDAGPLTHASTGYITYAILRDQATLIDGIAMYSEPSPRILGRGEEARAVEVGHASWDFFPLTGARPALGRFYDQGEDDPKDARQVVVLGHDLWRDAFAGDSGVIGRTITITGEDYTVIGVTPRGFTGVELNPVDMWLPMSLVQPVNDWPTAWNAQWLYVVARPVAGTSIDAVNEEATAIHRRSYTGRNTVRAQAAVSLRPTRLNEVGEEPPETAVARWLMGVAAIVLLIACANVGNLLLARGAARRRELAVRAALGSGTGRLVRLLVLEGVLIASGGAALGSLIAALAGRLVRTVLLPDVAWVGGVVDARVLAFGVIVAMASGVAVGLVPAIGLARRDLTTALKAGSQQSGLPRSRLRSTLLVAQCALSVMLLVGAGLFVRSLDQARAVDLGFEPDRVIRAQLQWPAAQYGEAGRARRTQVYHEALDRLRVLPDVERAAIAVGTPFGFSFGVNLRVPGHDTLPQLPGGGPSLSVVTSDYLEVMGARIIDGRSFRTSDRAGSERVVIVNGPMAAALWPGESAVGKCMYVFSDTLPCARVVGVVDELRREALREAPGMQYFVPLGQEIGVGGSTLMVRPRGSVESFIPTLERSIREVDPTLLSIRIESMGTVVGELRRQWRLGATLFTLFGALALAMSAIGLYSVIAYLVEQRRAEFGVRLALGSSAGGIVGLVLRGVVPVALGGIVLGLGVVLLAGPALAPLLFELSPRDPVVLVGVSALLGGVAILASAIPSFRATRIDPLIAMRGE